MALDVQCSTFIKCHVIIIRIITIIASSMSADRFILFITHNLQMIQCICIDMMQIPFRGDYQKI